MMHQITKRVCVFPTLGYAAIVVYDVCFLCYDVTSIPSPADGQGLRQAAV